MSTTIKEHSLFNETKQNEEKGQIQASSIGMTILLISLSMLFATLFLGYAIFRGSSLTWPPMGMSRVPLLYPSLSTLFLFLSSFTYFKFEKFVQLEQAKEMKKWISLTISLGLLFAMTQLLLWSGLKSSGVYVESGIFPSIIYGFTWIHAGHIFLGILGLLYLLPMTINYRQERKFKYLLWVTNVGKFWHFLGVVWFVMFITMFVL